jgi:hypothetical protein
VRCFFGGGERQSSEDLSEHGEGLVPGSCGGDACGCRVGAGRREYIHEYHIAASSTRFCFFVLVHTLTHELISFVNWTAHAWEDGRASCSVNPRWQNKCEHTVSLSLLFRSSLFSLFSLFSLLSSLSLSLSPALPLSHSLDCQ